MVLRTRKIIRLSALACVALGLSAPALAELTRANDSGFVSRHDVVVDASPKDVWLALIAPASWWRSEHTWSGDAANLTLTPQAGGCFCETIPEVDEPGRFTLQGSVQHMRVIQAYPEAALRMQGALGPLQSEPVIGILTIAISKVDAGTRIVWEYNVGGTMRYEIPVISKAVDGVMGVQLAALAKLLGPVAVAESEPEPDTAGADEGEAEAAQTESSADSPPPAARLRVAPTPSMVPSSKPQAKLPTVEDTFADLEDEPNI